MIQYIDKDALVAKIEKLIDEIYAGRSFDSLSSEQQTALWYVKSIMSSINTLEVKEVEETTATDRGVAEEIIINLKRVEQNYRIDLTKEMEWLRNKVKKEE